MKKTEFKENNEWFEVISYGGKQSRPKTPYDAEHVMKPLKLNLCGGSGCWDMLPIRRKV